MNLIKNNVNIIYPQDNLCLHQTCSTLSSQSCVYRLYSVINHQGSLNDGHYTTYSRNIFDDEQKWFECDDEIIKPLNSDQIKSNSNAYLLFYMIQ